MFPDFEIVLTTAVAVQQVMHLLVVDLHVATSNKGSHVYRWVRKYNAPSLHSIRNILFVTSFSPNK